MADVSATLHYSAPLTPGGPVDDWVIDAVSRPPETLWNFRQVAVETAITDLRAGGPTPRLDDMGFERVVAPTCVDQRALSLVECEAEQVVPALAAYQAETEVWLVCLTRADAVVFFDATLRHEDTTIPRAPTVHSPHMRVHVDQNPRSARVRATNHGGADRQFRRFQIVNIWRPLLESVRNYPLALCDYRSLDVAVDLVPTRLRFPPWLKDRENYSVQRDARHRWYYWGALSPDEVLVFKCYDSASRSLALASEGTERAGLLDVAGLCPHSAFFDRGGPVSGHLRTSLELRALLFYD
jgi:cephamycin C biosynthesis protein